MKLRKCREPVSAMASDSLITFKAFEGKEEGDDEVLPGYLMIKADGRVQRVIEQLPASSTFDNGTASKDVVIDAEVGSWARIFVPEVIASENTKKLPVVVNFHGGGFCLGDVGECGIVGLNFFDSPDPCWFEPMPLSMDRLFFYNLERLFLLEKIPCHTDCFVIV